MRKSCGAVVYRIKGDVEFLLVQFRGQHGWGFPKSDTMFELPEPKAAVRNVRDKTGLERQLIDGFSHSFSYRHGARKVTLYLGAVDPDATVLLGKNYQHYRWRSYQEAKATLAHQNSLRALERAKDYLATHVLGLHAEQ